MIPNAKNKTTAKAVKKISQSVNVMSGQVSTNQRNQIITQNPQSRQNLTSVVRWFNITNVSAEPMLGTSQVWDEVAVDWVDHNLVDAEIYPQPGASLSDYSIGFYPCVWSNSRWFALTGGGVGGIRHAYCKTAAGAGNTIVCYLNQNITVPPQNPPPTEITVYCFLLNASNLLGCIPLLTVGQMIPVYFGGVNWFCPWWFSGTESC